jgi:hypothetical protein
MGRQDDEYQNTDHVREAFNIENSEEYHYFGPVSEMEVSPLGDAFVKFRETCFKDYGLDAAYNYTPRRCCGM